MKSSKNTIGLYIHWPYCLSKCPYCDFASSVCKQIDEDILLSGYIRDMDNLLNGFNISTIFFGGGTPSLMSVNLCEKILNEIEKRIGLATVSEITIEANPDAIDLDKMMAFNQLGINRLSLGVQALNEKDLRFLGRKHSVQTALKRIEEAQHVFKRINMDLIYARPNQTLKQWEKELNFALSLGIGHYSLYQLTIEENTVFGRKKITGCSEKQAVSLYRLTDEIMTEAGCPAYEVSNYALPNHQCQHNLIYWRGQDYVGIGPAAHGRLGQIATQNPKNIQKWLTNGTSFEKLTPAEKQMEKLLMGLRLRQEWFDASDLATEKIHQAVQKGWLEANGNRIRPTLNGILVLDRLIIDLI